MNAQIPIKRKRWAVEERWTTKEEMINISDIFTCEKLSIQLYFKGLKVKYVCVRVCLYACARARVYFSQKIIQHQMFFFSQKIHINPHIN